MRVLAQGRPSPRSRTADGRLSASIYITAAVVFETFIDVKVEYAIALESEIARTCSAAASVGAQRICGATSVPFRTFVNISARCSNAPADIARITGAETVRVAALDLRADLTRTTFNIHTERHIGTWTIESTARIAIDAGTGVLTRYRLTFALTTHAARAIIDGMTIIDVLARCVEPATFISSITDARVAPCDAFA